MDSFKSEKLFRKIPDYYQYANDVSRGIHDGVLQGGNPLRRMVDFLHGVWLGHPLHPVLTDVTIGAWMMGAVLDLLAANGRSRGLEKAADQLTALGTASAIPTALAGIADYTTIPRRAMTTGATHGLLNSVGLVLYLISMQMRRSRKRSSGVFFSSLALGLLTISAWLGGELVYQYRVSVNKTVDPTGPQDWEAVMASDGLGEGASRRVEVDGSPVLVYRYQGILYAIGAVCGHDGGPLDEGRFDGVCVECPWHQTVYDMRDGKVVHGPSTYSAPLYETRVMNGNIELRLKQA